MDSKYATPEQIERIRQGEMAQAFLDSPEWKELVKPILDSLIMGIKDISQIDVSSEQKASVELKARKMAAGYLQEVETFIRGFVDDASVVVQVLEKKKGETALYKPRKK